MPTRMLMKVSQVRVRWLTSPSRRVAMPTRMLMKVSLGYRGSSLCFQVAMPTRMLMKVSQPLGNPHIRRQGRGNANADVDESVTRLLRICFGQPPVSGNANADVDESVTCNLLLAVCINEFNGGNANADVDESVTRLIALWITRSALVAMPTRMLMKVSLS